MTSSLSLSETAKDPSGLHALLAVFSRFGQTDRGGVTRLCASREDGAVRDCLAALLKESRADVRVDEVGNQFGLFPLADRAGAPLVMMGSHLDSQVRGGCLDGALGVAVAVCVGQALQRAKGDGARFEADFCAVNWTNEEGARFRPSLLGSGTYVGRHPAAYALSRTDDLGTSLDAALAAIGYRGIDRAPPPPACYLELHVEQGTVLEEAGVSIGIVTRNWGAIKIEAVFEGVQAHTGPGSMERRRDALVAAAHAIVDLRALADRWPGVVHTSVGRLMTEPNSANVVPARVALSVEIRSSDDVVLAEAGRAGDALLLAAAERARVDLLVESRVQRPARALSLAVGALVAACAEQEGFASMRMDTVAGHDALSFLDLCPTGLVFVPSLGGVSHNEDEATAREDLDAGLAVMKAAAFRLCRTGGDLVRALATGGVT